MARRSYDQYCPAARALDVLGERWTLLIVRELLLGPKRYTDLLGGLPGIGPNVLADRLRHLQAAGVVERSSLPPPAASMVYELTPLGQGLRPVVLSLMTWGLHFLGTPKRGESSNPGWLLQMLEAGADRDAARGVRESYQFCVDGTVLHVDVDDGRVEAHEGPAHDPALVSTTDLDTFLALGARSIAPADAVADGRLEFEGDPEAAERAIRILGARLATLGESGEAVDPVRAAA
jgi:DNA-binding HxlR family transcriptional regulator/putative sterol carrier protein